jgi:transitional endoplasmic reticulum ATPase
MDEKNVAVKERGAQPQEITRKIAEALPKDVGRGLARLDPADMASMGIEPGDVIRLIGERETAAKAMSAFPGDRGQGIVQIDGRRNTPPP